MTAARKAQQRWTNVRDRKCQALISYGRLSVKRQGGKVVELLSETVERQLARNADRAEHDGHVIAFELYDDGVSAYDETVTRDSWEEALRLIRTGQADGFLARHADRAVRQPIDAIYLMNAAKEAGIPVLFGDSKVYDFSDSADEFMFLVEAGLGKKSSQDTSRRVLDKLEKNREAGKMHGRSAYGFRRDPEDPKGPRIVNEAEAEVIREVARRVLAGETWKSIVDDLNERGVRTPDHGKVKGQPFTRTTLRAVLLAPRVAGLLTHRGEVVGRLKGRDGKPQAPILDHETWERVCSELKGRAVGAPRQTRFLLSGILVCGRCGNTMSSVETRDTAARRYRVYKCRGDSDNTAQGRKAKCSVSIMGAAAEEVVREAVIRWQSNPKRLRQITQANAAVDAKVADLQATLDRLMAISKRNAAKFDNGIWDEDTYAQYDGPNDERIKATKEEMKRLTQPSVLRDLAVESLTTSWDDATDDEKRAMVRVALRSVVVMPAKVKGGGGVDPRSRVVCDPR